MIRFPVPPVVEQEAIVRFLDYPYPRIVADALNTMARLKLKDRNDEVRKLLTHSDPIVRANAALYPALGQLADHPPQNRRRSASSYN